MITLKQILEKIKDLTNKVTNLEGKILYNNPSGTLGNVSLNEEPNNCKLHIFYTDSYSGYQGNTIVDLSISKKFAINGMRYNSNNNKSENFVTNFEVVANTIIVNSYTSFNRSYDSGNISGTISNYVKINKVVGYI